MLRPSNSSKGFRRLALSLEYIALNRIWVVNREPLASTKSDNSGQGKPAVQATVAKYGATLNHAYAGVKLISLFTIKLAHIFPDTVVLRHLGPYC
jgi:hypothetical protein